MTDHPPKPRLVLNVGITGHLHGDFVRFGFQVEAVRASVRHVLETIRNIVRHIHRDAPGLYDGAEPALRLISRMADGADLIAAEEAVALGYELQCPLPFCRDEYVKHVDPAWRESYEQLLARAGRVLELDGAPDPVRRDEAYFEGRRTVSRLCDVLIAVWHAESSTTRWGTTEIVREARRDSIITVQIPPAIPGELHLELGFAHSSSLQRERFEKLAAQLRLLLLPLENDKGEPLTTPPRPLNDYHRERSRRVTLGFLWPMLQDLLGEGRGPRLRVLVKKLETAAEEQWASEWAAAPDLPRQVVETVDGALRTHFMWADKLAQFYADLSRSSVVFIYSMGAMAVLLALIAYALGWSVPGHFRHGDERYVIGAELVVIGLVILTALWSRRRRWHERWIDYRVLAEQLRLQRCLMPLGRVTPFTRLPAHLAHGDTRRSWMYWLFRAINRQAGMIGARFDHAHLDGCRLVLQALVNGQQEHHAKRAKALRNADESLYWLGIVLFGCTFVACLVHLIHFFRPWASDTSLRWLTFANAVLPAFGAACAAVRSHSQLDRIHRHSKALAGYLRELLDEKLHKPATLSRDLGLVAEEVADALTTEVLDWRSLFKGVKIDVT